jgi:enamine deaminase RidA (YjgF/YER057c/UK114 family)
VASIERHGSGGPFEASVGYSRVVRAGGHVWVSGCTAISEDGIVIGVGDAYLQAQETIASIGRALAQVGARFEHVVRTRMYVVDIDRADDVTRAHGEVFGDIRPASAILEVSRLLDPRMLVEIEADAFVADATTS